VMCDCPAQCFVDQSGRYHRRGGHKFPIPWEDNDE
jgi:hypothetical protein